MSVIPIRPSIASTEPFPSKRRAPVELVTTLGELLLGPHADVPIPSVADILSAALALAEGTRKKSILPLAVSPAELVLMRRGTDALVSYYVSDGAPDVRVLDRALPLRALLEHAAAAATDLASRDSDPTSRQLVSRLAERALQAEIRPVREPAPPVLKRGGALDRPPAEVPLAFGFEASIAPVADPPRQTAMHSDVHALLFDGVLWVWARDRRIPLLRGPIMLAISRMVAAVRSLLEAHERGRPANVRLRAGSFTVGVRVARGGERPVQLTLGSRDTAQVSIPELTVEEAALPILRLASDVLHALVSVDRSQARNLRVSSLREEVRALRRRARVRPERPQSLVHDDPERLRLACRAALSEEGPLTIGPAPRALRFDVRWEVEVEGLDAASTFLCGDRLVVATPQHTIALDREEGRMIWGHAQPASASFMTGTVLVRVAGDGRVALCDIDDGETFATARVAPRTGGPPCGVLATGGDAPPVVILAEGRAGLVAVDLRTGELRWRHAGEGVGTFGLRRAGRILLVTNGDGAVTAIDVVTGELLWRLAADGERFDLRPAVSGDVVLAVSGEVGGDHGTLFGVDLFSGRALWRQRLETGPASEPITAGDAAALALGGPRDSMLAAFDPRDGRLRWMTRDPGISLGAASLVVDQHLIVNAPAGNVVALDLEDGRERWQRHLAHPVADDVPRRLEPVLRGGALFVPSASVHVLRPHDGTSIGEPLPSELVPDWTRVDERGWVYVAEESGHLSGLAPRPTLTLVT
ncbi:MAG: PQQ-binding-like beta-propeller repeat protein [Sandaracinaceae bacterium]|nr:PQQ-binding-like beta-propeller repeat protein [Sandaracinaceae bacterium]